MGRVTDTRHIGVPLFLGLCVVSIFIAVTPLWTAAQTPPATEQATSEGGAADTQAATGATVDTSGGAITEQGGAATGDSTDGTPSDNGAGNGNDAPSPTVAPTEPPLTPTEPIVAPTPTMPLDTPTPTPTPTLPNTDTLSATSDTAPATLQPGQTRQYTFTYSVTTPRTATTIHAELRLDDGSPATGWLLQAQAGQGALTGDGPTVDVTESGTLAPGGTFSLTIVAQAPKDVTAPQTVSLYISSTATTENGEVENGVAGESSVARLSVAAPSTPTPAPKQIQAQMVPMSLANWCHDPLLTAALEVTYSCDSFTGEKNTTYTLSIAGLSTTGWSYKFNASGTAWTPQTASGTAASIATFNSGNPAQTVPSFKISIVFDNTIKQPSSSGALTLTITHKGTANQTVNDQSSNLSASFCSPTASITSANGLAFPTSQWSGSSYPTVNGSLGLSFANQGGCSGISNGWSVQIKSDTNGLSRTGGGAIQASNITFTGGQQPVGWIAPSASKTLSTANQTIATGSATTDTSATWNAPFSLQPPNDAPPGDYSGTITITVASGG